jgi:hypothetical protein
MDEVIKETHVYLNLARDGKMYISRATEATRALGLSAGSEVLPKELNRLPLLRLEYVQMGPIEFLKWRVAQGFTPEELAARYDLTVKQVLCFEASTVSS